MSGTASFHPIVGIGASAGGVEALDQLFSHMPADTGCAFVIITHLAPDRRSLLPEIMARRTPMPVHEAMAGAEPQPNNVYVLPCDSILGMEDRRLTIRRPTSIKRDRKPIDIFFSALAKDIGEKAVGVVLSGGDSDGTLGVKAIKERGGLTLAQVADGTTPQHPDMPNSAIHSGMVDLAVSVNHMGAHIAQFARALGSLENLEESGRESDRRRLQEVRSEICAILRNQIGHDFSGYKEKTFLRRVERRMQVNHLETVEAYVERLRQDPKEAGALFRDLLINVTNFFRDAEAFQLLEQSVIPKLFAGRGAEDMVRVWVPGCATGEEVYSIAILLCEHMTGLTAMPRVQIFATDIDETALGVARAARYPESLLDGVSEARRTRFFTHDDGSYQVTKEVRDLCVFSPHSVIRDPPFSRLDLISCRNLLIYFGPEVQNQVIPTFHYALRPGGYLFLGTSENASQFAELFAPIDKKHRLFRSREDAPATALLPMTLGGLVHRPFRQGQPREQKGLSATGLRHAVEAHVLDRFAPAHVVVNRDGDVLYYSTRTGKYLEPMAGLPTRQLLAMARKGLKLDLRAILRDVVESGQRVVREGVTVETEEERVQVVNLLMEPVHQKEGQDPLFLLVFSDVGPIVSRKEAAQRVTAGDDAALQLERELRETRERLQSLIEEYETALEELKSSNEELVSVNEELQSTNEELEASKEEMQSVNEELNTVNAELNGKVDALDRSSADLANLFDSTRIAIVFLDRDLVIRSFTPEVSKFFNMRAGDRGRPLTDLAARISLPTLSADVRHVLASGTILERTIAQDDDKTHYLLRVAPYRGGSHEFDGVVLSFVDVSTLALAQANEQKLVAEMDHRIKDLLDALAQGPDQTNGAQSGQQDSKPRLVDHIRAIRLSCALLSQQDWRGADIAALVHAQLEGFGSERISFSGPPIGLAPKQTLALGMILHDLTADAAQHGALNGSGHVALDWRLDGPDIVLCWEERGIGKRQLDRRNSGLELVRERVSAALNGGAETILHLMG